MCVEIWRRENVVLEEAAIRLVETKSKRENLLVEVCRRGKHKEDNANGRVQNCDCQTATADTLYWRIMVHANLFGAH